MSRTFSIEELLGHSGWLHALARQLVSDPASAEDLAQETWIAALRRPPQADEPPRPWLARVARNLASNRRRAEGARKDHESRVRFDHSSQNPAEIVSEIEAQRALVDALASLAEPGRSVIVLRYFRQLDSATIAAELGLPASTVRWHHGRALAELRTRLDREHGGRAAWVAWLSPFSSRAIRKAESVPATPWRTPTLVATGAAVVLTCAFALWHETPAEHDSEQTPLLNAGLDSERALLSPVLSVRPTPRSVIESEPTPGHELFGRVFLDGRPAALDVELRFPGDRSEPRFTRSDAQGRFRVAGLEQRWLSMKVPGHRFEDGMAAETANAPFADEVELRLVGGPVLTGRFLEPGTRRPIAPPLGLNGFNAWYEFDWDGSGNRHEGGVFATGEDGRFCLALSDELTRELPRVRLHVELYDLGRLVVEVPPLDERGLDLGDLELVAGRAHPFSVHDASGKPIPLAFAQHRDWKKYAQCDERGQGTLLCLPAEGAWIRFGGERFKDELRFIRPEERTDVFLERTNALSLRVVSRDGAPLPALRMSITPQAQLFVPTDDGWDNVFQPEGSLAVESHSQPGEDRLHATLFAGSSGRLILRDLRPGLPFQIVLSSEGRTFAERSCALGEGEWQDLELAWP